MMYRIGIIGFGVVGKGVYNLLEKYVVATNDPKGSPKEKDIREFENLDMVVVCVPTPEDKDGSCDISAVEEVLRTLYLLGFGGVILVKSAVPPYQMRLLLNKHRMRGIKPMRIVVSPEYMGESKYYTPFWKYPDPQDMRSHAWQVFGGEKKDTSLCVDIFQRKMSVDCKFIQTDAITASLTKYMENSFFAMKVTFCNQMYDLAEELGVDYNELRECWLADTRINRNHTMVFKKDRGYGGKCFPKDVRAIIKDAENVGISLDLMKAVDEINEKIRNERKT